jgi:hypothetical protein
MNLADQFHRQTGSRLAPRGIGKVALRQVSHRRAGNVAVRNLLNKEPQGIARRESGVAERKIAGAGQLIDPIREEKIIRAVANASQSKIESSHPWPPVEE